MTVQSNEEKELNGIDGWLLFPAALTFLTAGGAVYNLVQGLRLLPGKSAATQSYLTLDMAFSAAIAIVGILAVVALLQKWPSYPRIFIGLVAFTLLKYAVEYWWLTSGGHQVGLVAGSLGSTIVTAAVWVPYMLVSKRVAITFRRPV